MPANKFSQTNFEDNHLTKRIVGYDFARSLAVLGMVIVNFKIVMGAEKAGPHWLLKLAGLLDGRAAATFVVLAGVGLSLLARQVWITNDASGIADNRKALLKRALFLFVVGLCYTPLWPADILHFYGIYIAIGALFLTVSNRWLWILVFTFMAIFVLFIFIFDYEAGWNWETISYSGFWTIDGMIRHLFFNGFHPVFPWTAFLLVGMLLGRQDMRNPRIRRKMFLFGLGTAFISECISWLIVSYLSTSSYALDMETVIALFGTEPMPPMPLYLFAGGGTAVAVIAGSIMLTEKYSSAGWIVPFVATGQLALTLYVAHVIIGMGTLDELGFLENQSPPFAIGSAVLFCVCAILFSHFWRKRFKRGPLEWVMRRVIG